MESARFNRDTMVIDESEPKMLYDEMPVGLLVCNAVALIPEKVTTHPK